MQYKAPHDLIAKSASVASGSTSRKTRRATTELRVSLAATISGGKSLNSSTPSSSLAKAKERYRAASGTSAILAGTKMVGKLKSPAKSLAIIDKPSSFSKGKGKATEVVNLQAPNPATEVMFPPPPLTSKRGFHPRRAKDVPVPSTPDTSNQSIPSTSSITRGLKRKNPSFSSIKSEQSDTHHSTVGDKNGESLFLEPEAPPQPKLTIKRIRLFQRPPPAVYTHPSQVPHRPQYGSSVQGYLQSYSSLEDGTDVPDENLEQMSFAEAKTRARIRQLKKEGRLMLEHPELPDDPDGITNFAGPEAERVEPVRGDDHYDHLVSAAAHRARLVSTDYAMKKSTAKKVSKLIMAWHGNREGTEEKQRKAEAVRMRTLAKVTAKEVERQWKRAVMVCFIVPFCNASS